jgi:prophage antirepressor-like protein
MQSINSFNFGVNPIRVTIVAVEPWFVAADVCAVLDLDSTATRRLDEDEKDTLRLTQGTSGNPNVTIVNESGLYSLVLGSRKPEAKAFKKWVTSEVLPAIRRTGSYGAFDSLIPKTLPEALVAYADALRSNEALADRVQAQQSTIATQTVTIEVQDEALGLLATTTKNALGLREAGKHLQIQPTKFITWMLKIGWVYRGPQRRLIAYQDKIHSGLMEHKMVTFGTEDGPQTIYQPLVTPKGMVRLAHLACEAGGKKLIEDIA